MADSDGYKDEIDALSKVLGALSKLDDSGKQFVMRTAADRLGIAAPAKSGANGVGVGGVGGGVGHAGGTGQTITDPNISAKHFMDQKRPEKDIEKVTCLAFYLAHNRATVHFKTADITALNTEAAQTALSNSTYALNNAESAGYLTSAGKRGHKQITAYGERIVTALPDREAVAAVIEAEKKRHARRKPNKKSAKAAKA